MEPCEEFFNAAADPLELRNLATEREHAAELAAMRQRYDQELAKWQAEAVGYNGYRRYGVMFDRRVSIETKSDLISAAR